VTKTHRNNKYVLITASKQLQKTIKDDQESKAARQQQDMAKGNENSLFIEAKMRDGEGRKGLG
jgi:hypothetical protein